MRKSMCCQWPPHRAPTFVVRLALAFFAFLPAAIAATSGGAPAARASLGLSAGSAIVDLHGNANGGLRRLLDVATGNGTTPRRFSTQMPALSLETGDEVFWDGFDPCGDGIIDSPDEQCDRADLGGATCSSRGYSGGTLACDSTCHFDTTQCGAACPVACASDLDCGACGLCFIVSGNMGVCVP